MPDQYQKEIEEILKNVGEPPPSEHHAQDDKPRDDRRLIEWPARSRRELSANGRTFRLPAITPSNVLLAGLIVLLIAALVNATVFVWVGLVMVAIGYVAYLMRPRTIRVEKYWRDRPLETAPRSAWDRFMRWMRL